MDYESVFVKIGLIKAFRSDSTSVLCLSVLEIIERMGFVELSLSFGSSIENPTYSTFLLRRCRTESMAGTKSVSELTIIAVSYLSSIAPINKSVTSLTSMPFSRYRNVFPFQ